MSAVYYCCLGSSSSFAGWLIEGSLSSSSFPFSFLVCSASSWLTSSPSLVPLSLVLPLLISCGVAQRFQMSSQSLCPEAGFSLYFALIHVIFFDVAVRIGL